MEEDTPPRAHCPECGSEEISVDRRYGIEQTIKVLARKLARMPYFWIGALIGMMPWSSMWEDL